jgi:type IV secretory pathway VirB2 component (pilin)
LQNLPLPAQAESVFRRGAQAGAGGMKKQKQKQAVMPDNVVPQAPETPEAEIFLTESQVRELVGDMLAKAGYMTLNDAKTLVARLVDSGKLILKGEAGTLLDGLKGIRNILRVGLLINFSLLCCLLGLTLFAPDAALTADVSARFAAPFKALLGLLSDTVAKLLAGLAITVAGLAYIFKKDDISGWVYGLNIIAIGGVIVVIVVLGASFVSFLLE